MEQPLWSAEKGVSSTARSQVSLCCCIVEEGRLGCCSDTMQALFAHRHLAFPSSSF